MPEFIRKSLLAFAAATFLAVLPNMAAAQNKTYKPTPAVQQEFNAYIEKFRAAVKANSASAVAELTRHPFYFNDKMGDAAEFRAKAYPYYFTAKNRACLQRGKAFFDLDGYKNVAASIFCGSLIFVFTRKEPDGFLFSDVSMDD